MAINNLGTGLRPGVCTSTTRPTTPYEGQVIYETDTDLMLVWNGTAWKTFAAAAPAQGTVLQTVQASTAVQATSSSQTPADTGLSVTITPQSVSSKILVMVSQAGCSKSAASIYNAIGLRLLRNSTSILTFGNFVGYNGAAVAQYLMIGTQSTMYLDSPSTTSAVTYKTQFWNSNGNIADVKVQDTIGGTSSTSTITVLEVAA